MAKNIVVCCDGTANEFALDRTNVVKLFYALDHSDPSRQVAYYHPGLGTMEPPGALTGFAKAITRLLGKAIGYGLESDVREAYVFLTNSFEPGSVSFRACWAAEPPVQAASRIPSAMAVRRIS